MMVAHLGLRTHELLNEEIGNIIAETLSAWEKAECYEELVTHWKIEKLLIRIKANIRSECFVGFL